ncbi:MAG: hypothetical protein ACR2M3_04480 [Thermomicrobiales bacterium]
MHLTNTMATDEQRGRLPVWRVVRWLIAAAASLMLVTLFLTQAASTEAAAPTPNTNVVYHEMAAPVCPAGFNCAANNCVGGYFCGYNPGFAYPAAFNYGCGFGGINCGINYAFPNFIAPAIAAYPFYSGSFASLPNNIFTSNGCPVGNYACLGFTNGCAVGNFSCVNANGVCPVGNFTCYNANFPFFTGVFNGNVATAAPTTTAIVVGPPFRAKEIAPPAAATTPASQPAAPSAAIPSAPAAAPAAPAANYATALNSTTPAPISAVVTAGGSNVHVLSAPPTTTPAASKDLDDHR